MSNRHQVVESADGTPLPVWLSGQGAPLLIVHGAATNHESWEAVRALLEPYVTVAVMDRRATFGDPLSRLDISTEFDDVAAVAGSLGDEVAVLGHSSGAQCALGAAPAIPSLAALILYEPPLDNDARYLPGLRKLEALLRAGDIDGVYDTWLKEYVGMPEDVAEEVKASPIGANIRSFAEYLPREMAAHVAWELEPEAFAAVRAPTTYLVGEHTPKENEQLRGLIAILEEVMPKFRVRELPGQGHFANFLAPDLLAEAVLDSLPWTSGRAS